MVSARMAIVSGLDVLYSWKQRLFICFLCIVLTYVGKMLIYMNNTELLSYLNYIIMPRRNSELVLAVGQQAATPNVRAIESTSFMHILSIQTIWRVWYGKYCVVASYWAQKELHLKNKWSVRLVRYNHINELKY